MSGTRPKPLNAGAEERVNGFGRDTKTRPSELPSWKEERLIVLRTLLRKRNAARPTTLQIEKPRSSSASCGPKTIGRESVKQDANGGAIRLAQNESNGTEPLLKGESNTEAAPSLPSVPSLSDTQPTSEIVASQSMSLLDESANHMFGLMKGLHANQPPADVKAFDPERVNSAVACANTIYKIMRLKLDAIKVQRKLK